jgi:hypothetical protein
MYNSNIKIYNLFGWRLFTFKDRLGDLVFELRTKKKVFEFTFGFKVFKNLIEPL